MKRTSTDAEKARSKYPSPSDPEALRKFVEELEATVPMLDCRNNEGCGYAVFVFPDGSILDDGYVYPSLKAFDGATGYINHGNLR